VIINVQALVNAAVTFGIAILPAAAVSIAFPSRPPAFRRIVKRLFFSGITANSFFLVLFSIYRSQSITSAFLYLCQEINVKFLLVVLFMSVFITGVLQFGKLEIKHGKIPVSKSILIIAFVPIFLITGSFRFRETYGIVPVEQLIFHVMMPEAGANFSMVYKVLVKTVIDSIILFVVVLSFLSFQIIFKKQGKTFSFRGGKKPERIGAALFCVAGIGFCIANMGVPDYMASLRQEPSTFYEEHYIDPNAVEITFPERKRNLIVIFIESLETGFLTRENGGAFSESPIPEIESLMKNNINFSAGRGAGGAHELYGTEWTIAGITAQYSGVPLAVTFFNRTDWNNYGNLGNEFLRGASGAGDILRGAGYANYFILGSEIEFGGRDKYFKTHKDTVIYDYHYFHDHGYIPKDYRVWWGIEDRKLYRFAKEKIAEASGGEPFFITLLTADTHPPDGYLDAEAGETFDSRFKNVLFDASAQLADFL
jgi:phosphoglycerol transferase